ncbi:ATP-grasp domain-containing protein [Arthrobacter sp. KFRI-F3372]|uniref:ATP-grasp domain-containing protein n=1 Tax=Pseudarthrobacter oxydans TaxID=1671 RepID=UPI0027A17AD5|nr:ATP-grasp domain-containing protein [Actinomycetes bacterium ARC8]WHP59819.1 ATP-grasp domain-containing protein [Arthrobacter sp. KFRI-F3372]
MARILLVGGGRGLQNLIRERTPNLRTIVLARTSAIGLVPDLEVNDFVGLLPESASTEEWVQTARAIQTLWPYERVTALAEIDQDKAAAIAADQNMEYHAPDLVRVVNDKHEMRQRLAKVSLTRVDSELPRDEHEAVESARRLGYPVVIKPNGGRGSAGVRIVESDSAVIDAFRYASEIGTDSGAEKACLISSPPMIEQFVNGREFSVEAFSHEGNHVIAAVTEKFIDQASKVEIGHVVPARISGLEHEQITEFVDAILTALGIRFGATHTEVMLSEHGPELIETHLRKAGDEILELVRDATGWTIDEATVDQAATGRFIHPGWDEAVARTGGHYTGAAAIWFAQAEKTGRIDRIQGLDELLSQTEVREAKALVAKGTLVGAARSSLDRVARVRVVAQDSDTAVAIASGYMETLSFVYQEDS